MPNDYITYFAKTLLFSACDSASSFFFNPASSIFVVIFAITFSSKNSIPSILIHPLFAYLIQLVLILHSVLLVFSIMDLSVFEMNLMLSTWSIRLNSISQMLYLLFLNHPESF